MPVCCDPADLIPFVLKTDRAKPEGERPTFLLRALSSRQSRTAAALVQTAVTEDNEEKVELNLDAAIATGLAGVRNVTRDGQPVEVGATLPSSYLSPAELWELATAVVREPQLSEDAKKKSSSESTSAPVSSAGSAGTPASASAPATATA